LGNLESKRDWGYAPEYVEAMWRILQLNKPEDLVFGSGESHSVRDFVEQAFSYPGLKFDKYVKIDKRYFRPMEVEELLADPRLAKNRLDWESKITFKDLVKIMVDADMRKMGLTAPGEGDESLEKKFSNRWGKVD